MKKISLLLAVIFVFLIVGVSYAENIDGQLLNSASRAAKLEARVTQTAENQETKIQNLKKRADTEIQRRIEALNKLIAKINEVKKLSTEQKTNLQTQVQAQIDGLNTLKVKIDADTDLVTLKTDVQSIITDYRIFAFFIQDVHLLTAVERMNNAMLNMSTVSAKLQTRLQTAQANGKDVTAQNTLLSDMQAKITFAQSLLLAVNAQLTGLTAQGYPANKATLEDAKTKLQTVVLNMKTAGQDAKQIIQGLREMGKIHPSETPLSSTSALPRE